MGINRIIKRAKIATYGKKAGRSRAESLKIFSAFKKGFIKANSMTPAQIEKLERLNKIEKIKDSKIKRGIIKNFFGF